MALTAIAWYIVSRHGIKSWVTLVVAGALSNLKKQGMNSEQIPYIYIYQIQVKKHFSKGTLSGDASGRWYRAFGRDISKQEKCVEAWKQF